MRTNITEGCDIEGFKVLEVVELPEFDATGIYARHNTGAELFHLLNDDSENLFAFTFATAVNNSSGVAHILEHCVLSGSKHYPLKDPFIILAQGSLQTYLNAWTYPDKTVYPASSVNEADYFNLMSVYGDAVFFPSLEELTFMQEGHRVEFDGSGRPARTGIVYNEMKGAYSDIDDYAHHLAYKALFGNSVYAFDSGGDPARVPELRYEDFVKFHKEKYVPANCKIFLAGNIDTRRQCAFINEKFLSGTAPGKSAPLITPVPRRASPTSLTAGAPRGADDNGMTFISWICGNSVMPNSADMLDLYAMTDAILGHDGAPLMRKLTESALGEDVTGGPDVELRDLVWSAGLRGVRPRTRPSEVENLVMNELSRLEREGIPKREVEAALFSMDFANREEKRSGGPWSLNLLCRSLRGWLHGAKPWELMVFDAPFAALKNKIAEDGRYLESVIRRELLDNPHRTLLCVRPERAFVARREKAAARSLNEYVSALSPAESAALKEKNRDLLEKQSAADSPEALRAIPHIGIANLSPKAPRLSRSIHEAAGLPVMSHKINTRGITYMTIGFCADVLAPEDYMYLPLFCHCATALSLPGMNYAEVSGRLAVTAGDFYASPWIGTAVETPAGAFYHGRDRVFYRIKCPDGKIEAALDLVVRVITESKFDDEKRLRSLILELKNDAEASVAPNGSAYTACRSGATLSLVKAKAEVLGGLTRLGFIREIARKSVSETGKKLTALRDRLIATGSACIHITGESESRVLTAISRRCSLFTPTGDRHDAQNDIAAFTALSNAGLREAFSSASLQTGFAGTCLRASSFNEPQSVHEFALAHHLSTGAMWEKIRMKGGAYGVRVSADSTEGTWTFSTYRDPKPALSLEYLSEILLDASREKIPDDTLEKIIIGSYSQISRPHTNAQKASQDFHRFLSGITDDMRDRRREYLLSMRAGDLNAAAESLLKRNPSPPRTVLAGKAVCKTLGWGVRPEAV